MNHLLHFVGLTIHLTHHMVQMKKSQRISAIDSLKYTVQGREVFLRASAIARSESMDGIWLIHPHLSKTAT